MAHCKRYQPKSCAMPIRILKHSWRKVIYFLLLISNYVCGFNSGMLHGRPQLKLSIFFQVIFTNSYWHFKWLRLFWEEFKQEFWLKFLKNSTAICGQRLICDKMIMSCWLTIWDLSSSSIEMEFLTQDWTFQIFLNLQCNKGK